MNGDEKSGEMIDSKFLVLCSSRGAEYSIWQLSIGL